ncbi:hypothetical protein CCR75_009708 [Bremia lactucae]|uniref:Uncharacterized protein n=1 Tax=Bremia lactucae TaxID=4779 RepID=A0A976FP16_BRELC|nr:hypothetical protein CCR75_009708 [Bremia lactucae]
MENGPNDYTTMRSTRDSDLSALTMHTDEKNDLVEKQKKRRLTIILIGLALLGVIVVSVLISISVNGSSSVHTESAQNTLGDERSIAF